jgi:hypothetical protein
MLRLSSIRQRVRQRRFPPEFRIAEPAHPVPPEPEPGESPADVVSDVDDDTMADVATSLWRVLRRLADENGDATRTRRMATRHLTAMSERLAEAGVQVTDHDGLAFDPGLSLKAIAYEPRPAIDRETVVETVRPSVYRAGRCIQYGQVIVGTPEKGPDDGS